MTIYEEDELEVVENVLDLQGIVYNGKDRVYALKVQGLWAPDGMCCHMHKLYTSSHSDAFMIRDSKLQLQWLEAHFFQRLDP